MNKKIFSLLGEVEYSVQRLREALAEESRETAWFDNGKIIVNGVEYPIQNFKIEWNRK